MLLNHGQQIANEIIKHLQPHCQRIAIAGSVRRQAAVCKDVEIVCVPNGCKAIWNKAADIFGGTEYSVQYAKYSPEFIAALSAYPIEKGHPTGRYVKINYMGSIVDVFICTPTNFGYIHAIRTGPKSISQRLVVNLKLRGYECKDGWVYKDGHPGELKEESEVFALAQMKFYDPQYRK
jgi:DNA polymerase/3'-5' exonuclease PolX